MKNFTDKYGKELNVGDKVLFSKAGYPIDLLTGKISRITDDTVYIDYYVARNENMKVPNFYQCRRTYVDTSIKKEDWEVKVPYKEIEDQQNKSQNVKCKERKKRILAPLGYHPGFFYGEEVYADIQYANKYHDIKAKVITCSIHDEPFVMKGKQKGKKHPDFAIVKVSVESDGFVPITGRRYTAWALTFHLGQLNKHIHFVDREVDAFFHSQEFLDFFHTWRDAILKYNNPNKHRYNHKYFNDEDYFARYIEKDRRRKEKESQLKLIVED